MITETIESEQFIALEQGFLHWLETLGYSPRTVVIRRRSIREFLLYLERCNVYCVEGITPENTRRFVRYLTRRENRRFGAGLSVASINVGIGTVNKFFDYLRQNGQESIALTNLAHLRVDASLGRVLTHEEVLSLYNATHYSGHFTHPQTKALQRAISQRDRVMLGIYYGCGLRKSEGAALDVADVLLRRGLLYVRHGKGGRERYVPISEKSMRDIHEYLQGGRPLLSSVSSFSTEGLFLNQMGGRCSDQALSSSLKKLIRRSGNASLQEKAPSLHILRHSIATHLLQSGMQIELIQQFLGHQSLESTQIYTHLVNEF